MLLGGVPDHCQVEAGAAAPQDSFRVEGLEESIEIFIGDGGGAVGDFEDDVFPAGEGGGGASRLSSTVLFSVAMTTWPPPRMAPKAFATRFRMTFSMCPGEHFVFHRFGSSRQSTLICGCRILS